MQTTFASDQKLYCDEFHCDQHYNHQRLEGTGDWLLIYTFDGGGVVTTAKGSLGTEPGDIIVYAPNERQDYGTSPPAGHWGLLWVHFLPRPHWLVWLRWSPARNGVKYLRLKEELRTEFESAIRRMIWLSRRNMPGSFDLAANALEGALLWANVSVSQERWLEMDGRVRQAMDYLVTHLNEPFQLNQLARSCALSVSRLAHLFKAETGSSLQQFHEHQRMLHAAQLLRLTNLGVAEVAAELGYRDPFYFSNRFRRHSGKSPSAFRVLSKETPK